MLATLALVGCVEQSEELGDVTVAVTAPAADGSIYRLTPGTRASLDGGSFHGEYLLDGDGVRHLEVPLGAYLAALVHDDGYTTIWPLERLALDGTIETVEATLTSVMPAPVTVIADVATPLVFTFQIGDVGSVTFASGDVDVSIDVGEVPASGITVGGDGDLTASSVDIAASAPAGLDAVLPALDQAVHFGITAITVGDWAPTSATSACVDVATSFLTSSGHDGFSALVTEPYGTGQLCIYADNGRSHLQLSTSRFGQATTSTFAAFGDHSYGFSHAVWFTVPVEIFDGDTLHLDDLVGTQVVPATLYAGVSVLPAGSNTFTEWYSASFEGTMTFQLGATL